MIIEYIISFYEIERYDLGSPFPHINVLIGYASKKKSDNWILQRPEVKERSLLAQLTRKGPTPLVRSSSSRPRYERDISINNRCFFPLQL